MVRARVGRLQLRCRRGERLRGSGAYGHLGVRLARGGVGAAAPVKHIGTNQAVGRRGIGALPM